MRSIRVTNHISRQLARSRPPRKRNPYDHLTKAELWERLQAAQDTLERVAGLTNDLGRDLRRARYTSTPEKLVALSQRTYRVRDIARSGR